MDKLRIQIVNYKTKKYLFDCLESLSQDLEFFRETYSVAILDNASGDDLSDITATFPKLKNIEIYRSELNLGFGSGHNRLAKRGDSKYLLLLNPDTRIVEPQTVERLIGASEREHTTVVGPRLITGLGKTQSWDHGELHGLRAWIAHNFGASYWRERTDHTEVAWVSGAVFLVRKDRFDELSGFDEHFFLYKEDEDLCLRLRARGGQIIYDPTITIFHHGGVVARKSEHMKKSVDHFLKKHFSRQATYPFLRLLNRVRN